jgi:hypothetical protein
MNQPKKSDRFGVEWIRSRINPKMRQQLTGFAFASGGMVGHRPHTHCWPHFSPRCNSL